MGPDSGRRVSADPNECNLRERLRILTIAKKPLLKMAYEYHCYILVNKVLIIFPVDLGWLVDDFFGWAITTNSSHGIVGHHKTDGGDCCDLLPTTIYQSML